MSQWAGLPTEIGTYRISRSLGKGAFSIVKEGIDMNTHAKYAIKIIPKCNMHAAADMERFEREVRVVLKMNHPGIIKIYDLLADDKFFYLVMELFHGKDLLEFVPAPGTINERESKIIFKQILDTINYIHGQGVAHRDLKLENVLMDSSQRIKLIDFGFSRAANPGQMFQTPCGSPAYAAPEVIDGQTYDGRAADMWSCGVVLFCLVTGELPWKAGSQLAVFKQISEGNIDIPKGVSKECAGLIERLLCPNPVLRFTAADALSHPWLDGVSVSWDSAPGIMPVLSERKVTNILQGGSTSTGNVEVAKSPRTIIAQMAGQKIAQSKGSMSFGKCIPGPNGFGMRKAMGQITPLKPMGLSVATRARKLTDVG